MSKSPIKWHQNCLNNQINYLARLETQLEKLKVDYRKREKEVMFYKMQLYEAIAQGKDGFDSDRYLIKRKGK